MTDQRIKYLKEVLKLTAVDYTFVSRVEEKGVNKFLIAHIFFEATC